MKDHELEIALKGFLHALVSLLPGTYDGDRIPEPFENDAFCFNYDHEMGSGSFFWNKGAQESTWYKHIGRGFVFFPMSLEDFKRMCQECFVSL